MKTHFLVGNWASDTLCGQKNAYSANSSWRHVDCKKCLALKPVGRKETVEKCQCGEVAVYVHHLMMYCRKCGRERGYI